MTSRIGTRSETDPGFATIWVITAIALVAVAAGVAVCYGGAAFERHRAAAAADAVALAVALDAVQGQVAACRTGAALGRLDGAEVTNCELDGAIADIAVGVQLPGPLARFGLATGHARAGPVSAL
jgi:secretion/DNA translocation related TadE-like protein